MIDLNLPDGTRVSISMTDRVRGPGRGSPRLSPRWWAQVGRGERWRIVNGRDLPHKPSSRAIIDALAICDTAADARFVLFGEDV